MGGVLSARRRPELELVATVPGAHSFADGSEELGKGYLWLTADRQLRIATNGPDGEVVYRDYTVDHADFYPGSGRFTLDDGRSIDTRVKECGCGMGAAGNAPYATHPHKIVRVSPSTVDWVTVHG